MNYSRKFFRLLDNYVISRVSGRSSTAQFWYLPEPAIVDSAQSLRDLYSAPQPLYPMDYRAKLKFRTENELGIIVLPYESPTGPQINPEAAFQFALGLHDTWVRTQNTGDLNRFLKYANYFVERQTPDGLWTYAFDWHGSKAPWSSALAQSRGASVMLRAWLQSGDPVYRDATRRALEKFSVTLQAGGFLHVFERESCPYFEEYPGTPTGVINGFMSSLISLWDVNFYLKDNMLNALWQEGIVSLEKMLPHYTNGWWSLYDLDDDSPILNVNSPRYHLLELNYLKVLQQMSGSDVLSGQYENRRLQYKNWMSWAKALGLKTLRKVLYR